MTKHNILDTIEKLTEEGKQISYDGWPNAESDQYRPFHTFEGWMTRVVDVGRLIKPTVGSGALGMANSVRAAFRRTRPTGDRELFDSIHGTLMESLKVAHQQVTDLWSDEPVVEQADTLSIVDHLCRRFRYVARQLRHRYSDRSTLDIQDEYDVQDLFHALLTLHFDDIRPEEWTPSYAGASSRVDFLLPSEEIVIEIKKTRSGLADKQVGEQLIIDIHRYQAHPGCKTLVCFVYDPEERIANPRGIENDLSGVKDGLSIVVIISN